MMIRAFINTHRSTAMVFRLSPWTYTTATRIDSSMNGVMKPRANNTTGKRGVK